MDTPQKIEVEDPSINWAKFYTFQGLTLANLLDEKAVRILNGYHVITLSANDEDIRKDAPFLVCADDKPIFRIRTFESFAAARRFMSSLVLRGVDARMRIVKVDYEKGAGF